MILQPRIRPMLIGISVIIVLVALMIVSFFNSSHSDATVEAFSGNNRYTVKSGDTLFRIAGKYGITVKALKEGNTLNSDSIIPGQVLNIPRGSLTEKQEPVPQMPPSSEKISPTEDSKPEAPVSVKPLGEILREKGINDFPKISIVVDKSAQTLSVVTGNLWLKTYHVELGDNGKADKQVQGDHKTPEGTFYVAEKSVLYPEDQFLGTRWLRLSYPNIEDAERGIKQGLIEQKTYAEIVAANNAGKIPSQTTALGGGVGIHGGSSPEQGTNWTWGCVGLTNKDVQDFFDYVSVGTPIIIHS